MEILQKGYTNYTAILSIAAFFLSGVTSATFGQSVYDEAKFRVNENPRSVVTVESFDEPIPPGYSVELQAHGLAGNSVERINTTTLESDPNALHTTLVPGSTSVTLTTAAGKAPGDYPLTVGGKYTPLASSAEGGRGSLPSWSGEDVASVAPQRASITNSSRGGDKVVSSKISDEIQGRKDLRLKLSPAPTDDAPYLVRIFRSNGSAGSASIEGHIEDDPDLKMLTDGGETQTIRILGREASSDPRNMKVEIRDAQGAVVKDAQGNMAQWTFTVFSVGLRAFEQTNENVPFRYVSTNGVRLKTFVMNNFNHTNMGHHEPGGNGPYQFASRNWIYIDGKISPAGINKNDFKRAKDGSGFDFKRKIDEKTFKNGALVGAKHNKADDPNNTDEDLFADPFRQNNKTHLYVAVIDGPSNPFRTQLHPNVGNGDNVRRRSNFHEWLEYGGVRCSIIGKWWEAQSIQAVNNNVVRDNTFDDGQDDDDDDDNNVDGTGTGHIHLTNDMQEP